MGVAGNPGCAIFFPGWYCVYILCHSTYGDTLPVKHPGVADSNSASLVYRLHDGNHVLDWDFFRVPINHIHAGKSGLDHLQDPDPAMAPGSGHHRRYGCPDYTDNRSGQHEPGHASVGLSLHLEYLFSLPGQQQATIIQG